MGFTQVQKIETVSNEAISYVYCFVRQDLTLPQQVVQACHACIEIARLLSPDIVHPHLVILGIDSEFQLQHVAARLEALGIQYQPFYEPDLGSQLTSLATEPLSLQQRKAMQRYRCWGESALTKKDKNKRGRNMSSVSNTHRSRYGFHPCNFCLLYTSPSPRDRTRSRMPSSA